MLVDAIVFEFSRRVGVNGYTLGGRMFACFCRKRSLTTLIRQVRGVCFSFAFFPLSESETRGVEQDTETDVVSATEGPCTR